MSSSVIHSDDDASIIHRHTSGSSSVASLQASAASNRGFVCIVALVLGCLTTIPYLIELHRLRGLYFLASGHSASDYAIYLTWMRLASLGQLRDPHLYGSGFKAVIFINPTYLAIGRLVRWTHLALPVAYHVARLALIIPFTATVWWFVGKVVADISARRCALLFVCFSSGLGWLLSPVLRQTPIDLWQPEAVTFLSVYLYPHFIVGMTLQMLMLGMLLSADRTGKILPAVGAGILAAALAVAHTFDLVPVSVAWGFYLLVKLATSGLRNPNAREGWIRTLKVSSLAALIGMPGIVYILLQYRLDAAFAGQDRSMLSYGPLAVLAGYASLLILAIAGLRLEAQARREQPAHSANDLADGELFWNSDAMKLIATWALVGLVIVYAPVSFQRKLAGGGHIPIAILAAIGWTHLLRRYVSVISLRRELWLAVAATVILSLSNVKFVLGDIKHADSGELYGFRSTLNVGEVSALRWVNSHTPADAVVQALPWYQLSANATLQPGDTTLMLFSPTFADRAEYVGHWSETPYYDQRFAGLLQFMSNWNQPQVAAAWLRSEHISYIVVSQPDSGDAANAALQSHVPLPPYLREVYSNASARVYIVSASNKP